MSMTGYYPIPEAIDRLIKASRLLIDKAMDSDDLATRHNAFVDYVLALIFCTTGHRPVIDPIHSSRLFDLERGWLLVNDKVAHEERAWRISALPPIACEQLQHYLDYLQRLATWLDCNKEARTARDQVLGLLAGKESIPLFFYMDTEKKNIIQSITPRQMRDRWDRYWRLPLNFMRHVAATELAMRSGQPRLTQIQLGHSAGTDHAFGVAATESVAQVMTDVREHSEGFMQALGWEAVRCPVRMPKNSKLLVPASLPAPQKLFGSDKRKQQRQKNHANNSEIVRTAIQEITASNQVPLNLEHVEKIQTEVITSAPPTQRNACLRLLYRFISRLQGGKALLKELTQYRALELERSPFTEDSLVDYQKAGQLRQSFLTYLDDCYKEDEPTSLENSRIAEIILSASLFCGLATPQFLQALPKALLNYTFQLNGQLFLDLPLSDKNSDAVFRWFPGPLSNALIQGLYSYLAEKTKEPAPDEAVQATEEIESIDSSVTSDPIKLDLAGRIQQRLKKLLRTLGVSSEKDIWQLLAETAQNINRMERPGHTCAILDGRIASVSLPLPQWVRIQNDKALNIQPGEENTPEPIEPPFMRPDSRASRHTEAQTRKFLHQLISTFSIAADHQPSGNSKRSTVQKKQLESLLKQNFVENSAQWSQPAILIIAWALHLCRHGTRAKKNLAFNTIKKYVPMVARALLLNAPDKSLLEFEADEFESLYLEIIEAQPPNRKEDIAGRLYEFHYFLMQVYAADSLAWGEIFKACGNESSEYFADANMIAESEYLAVLDAIKGCKQLPDRQRMQYQVMLILGYRFGLRFGEAFRLQYRDIQRLDELMLLTVRNNIYGDLKSSAAQRIVPLLEKLSELEQEALSRLLQNCATLREDYPQIALMASDSDYQVLIDKPQTAACLNQVLKEITGDSTLRYHHLRHSWASRFYAFHYSIDTVHPLASQSVCQQRWSEFVGSHNTRYPLSSLSTALGHLDESTTLASYVHSGDASYSQKGLPEQLKISHKAMAYALFTSYASARQKSSRGILFKLNADIPQPSIALQPRPQTFTPASRTLTEETITPVSVEKILLRSRQSGHSSRVIAHELLMPADLVELVLKCAAKAEQISGFDFYMVEALHNETLTISDKERGEILSVQQEQKSYKLQNENMLKVLSYKYVLIEKLIDSDKQKLADAFRIWAKTLLGKHNFINDENSRETLLFMFGKLMPEIGISIQPASTLKSPEKSKIRKEASRQVTCKPGGKITTQQMLGRVLFVLAVYFEMTSQNIA